jgi:hypothetical protein
LPPNNKRTKIAITAIWPGPIAKNKLDKTMLIFLQKYKEKKKILKLILNNNIIHSLLYLPNEGKLKKTT